MPGFSVWKNTSFLILPAGIRMEKGLMKKRAIFGLLAFALVIGFGVTGCDTTTGNEKDSWTDVNMADLDGLWEGAFSETLTVKELGNDEWSDIVPMFGDTPVNITVDMIVDADANPRTVTAKMTMVFSFADIVKAAPELWETIILLFADAMGEPDDEAHSITITNWEDKTSVLSNGGLQINQNGTKIKVPANWLEEDTPESTLTKQ
jgi:hypothetical protein